MGHNVFISHSTKDKRAADAVCAALERAGVRCWVAPRDILPGANWAESILNAIAGSRLMVLVFSRHTQDSQHIRREVERAVHHGIAIAPIRIDDVMPAGDLEYFLSSSHWMDAMTPPFDRHLGTLSQQVRGLLEMAGPPATPVVAATPLPAPSRGRRWKVPAAAAVLLAGLIALAAWPPARGRVAGLLSSPATPQPAGSPSAPVDPAPGNTEVIKLRAKIGEYYNPQAITNTLGMKLMPIPPGTFLMGSPAKEWSHSINETQHRVRITKPFRMGAHEVTRGQFAAFVRDAGYRTDAEKEGFASAAKNGKFEKKEGASWQDVGFDQTDNHPVVNVSWNDAVVFAEWLSRKEGKKYRLPTEAEWEYACRAGTDTANPWGDDPYGGRGWTNAADLTLKKQFQLPDSTTVFKWEDGYTYTAPVGKFRPNAWGLYDMIGNAWEWCADWHASYPAGDATDPTGPANAVVNNRGRVFRGGAWNEYPASCRAAKRTRTEPENARDNIGFRLCLDLE